jgi:hypothetical protein
MKTQFPGNVTFVGDIIRRTCKGVNCRDRVAQAAWQEAGGNREIASLRHH